MTIQVRKSEDRGFFDYGWLKTYHTFSFGQYYDPNFKGFHTLRVLNEDRLLPGTGFPLHSHHDMEIFSVVVEGALTHQDDIGHGSILRPGQIQLMSAGRGVTHTELNASDKETTHFLQIWILPNVKNLKPNYQEKFFPPATRHNKLCLIISYDGKDGSLRIHQDAKVYLSNLDRDHEIQISFEPNHVGWIQLIQGELKVNDTTLEAGDGAEISDITSLLLHPVTDVQLIFIDLKID